MTDDGSELDLAKSRANRIQELDLKLERLDKEISDAFRLLESAIKEEISAKSLWRAARNRAFEISVVTIEAGNAVKAGDAANSYQIPVRGKGYSAAKLREKCDALCSEETEAKEEAARMVSLARERIDVLRDLKSIAQTQAKLFCAESESEPRQNSRIGTFRGVPINVEDLVEIASSPSGQEITALSVSCSEEHAAPVAAKRVNSWIDDL